MASRGKPIDLPEGTGLQIVPIVRTFEDKTIVALRVTGYTGQLVSWGPAPTSEGSSYEHEATEVIEGGIESAIHVYPVDDLTTDVLAGLGLDITVFVPTARYRVPFELVDIPLP